MSYLYYGIAYHIYHTLPPSRKLGYSDNCPSKKKQEEYLNQKMKENTEVKGRYQTTNQALKIFPTKGTHSIYAQKQTTKTIQTQV